MEYEYKLKGIFHPKITFDFHVKYPFKMPDGDISNLDRNL